MVTMIMDTLLESRGICHEQREILQVRKSPLHLSLSLFGNKQEESFINSLFYNWESNEHAQKKGKDTLGYTGRHVMHPESNTR